MAPGQPQTLPQTPAGDGQKRAVKRPATPKFAALQRMRPAVKGVFIRFHFFRTADIAFARLRAHSKSESVVPVCRTGPRTGRGVFKPFQFWKWKIEKESLYELDDQRPSP
ncbi:MAG: hypothetical protein EOO28_24020 [Comamonadaceae bacterium]|nr:MAG: hypothetical protein EOO28_24020 [Comamonadaceae bacterium]